jgi:uncharacterized protein YbbC (DUF1343 family)
VKIFTPEHGLRSLDDGLIEDGTDPLSGLPVISLYKKNGRLPKPEDLFDVDLVVMDLQDVGMRYYTYFSTVAGFLKVAAGLKKPVMLLDRPNPLGGERVEGEVLDSALAGNFIGFHTVPTRHGMTLGELALLYLSESGSRLPFRVVEALGWRREAFGETFERDWRASSPAIREPEQIELYSLFGTLEQFNLAVGRGLKNENAFRTFGAPFISPEEAEALVSEWNALGFPGVGFKAVSFVPEREIHVGVRVNGFRVELTGNADARVRSDELTYRLSKSLIERFSDRIRFSRYAALYFGSEELVSAIREGCSWEELQKRLDAGIEDFKRRRAPFLLYSSSSLK